MSMSVSGNRPIVIVQGAQWGSEAKGMVAAALCERRKIEWAVRTGAVNAGHTVYKSGVKYVNQQLPTGWVNDGTKLVLGAGAFINPAQLALEVEMLRGAGWRGLVFIDNRAGLHLPEHTQRSSDSGRHYRIGATGKGCSEAIVDRIRLRGRPEARLFKDWWKDQWEEPWMESVVLGDTAQMLHRAYDEGEQILLEGTQGTLLDLYLGPYPYTTHKQCTAAQWVVEAGLSPSMDYEVVLVARTYPIRVAGNSGPMSNEIDWPTLTYEINNKLLGRDKPVLVDPTAAVRFMDEWNKLEGTYATENVEKSERDRDALAKVGEPVLTELKRLWEFTTVTKKLRRIARISIEHLQYSVMLNRPSWVCLTFLNYEFPELWHDTQFRLSTEHWGYVHNIEQRIGAHVNGVSTGPESQHLLLYGDQNLLT